MEAVKEKGWKDYVPENTYLYYIDYNSNLDENSDVLQESVSENSIIPISEMLGEFYEPNVSEYMTDIRKKMRGGGCEELFESKTDEILDLLYSRDKSEPINDLLRNTSPIPWFFSLGEEFGDLWNGGSYNYKREEGDIETICKLLGIDPNSEQGKIIRGIRQSANYGGELRIYFRCDLRNLLTVEEEDFTAIHFKGKYAVGIINQYNGSGDFEEIELDRTFTFKRDNLFHAKVERYNIYDIFGIYDSAIPEMTPRLLVKHDAKIQSVETSSQKEYLQTEAKLNETFKNGGCTLGDMNVKRHRDVAYRNIYPCGLVCPHCGTFWID